MKPDGRKAKVNYSVELKLQHAQVENYPLLVIGADTATDCIQCTIICPFKKRERTVEEYGPEFT